MAVTYRTNLTMRQLAPHLGTHPATACQVIQRLGPLPALEPATRPAADVDRLWIVDGTLIPVRDRKVAASSRTYRFSANVEVTIRYPAGHGIGPAGAGEQGRCPRVAGVVPAAAAAGTTMIADGAYLGTGLIVSHRRTAGRPLLRGQE
ncbi:hypothetical protein Sros01_29600 [Streptomyces roseochromogenus]|nr:hypothetical protein Sros01_29600 [Streptomyces roseochromogenus]